jgi:hypothetical protein
MKLIAMSARWYARWLAAPCHMTTLNDHMILKMVAVRKCFMHRIPLSQTGRQWKRTSTLLVTWSSTLVLLVLVSCLFCQFWTSDWNSCLISVNHMIRNLDGALLFLFSSVSVEISLWSHIFLWLDGFSMLKSSFSKNLCYGTLYCPWMSINVNVVLDLVGLVTFTGRVRWWDGNFVESLSFRGSSMVV